MEYRILIADDEADLREMVRYNLEAEGYQVTVAEDGQEAVDLTVSTRPHLIVLDIRMPGLDGLEVCRRIRSMPSVSATPIIMLTALGQEQDEIVGFGAGADDYIQKPVSPKVLLTRIQARLRRAFPEHPEERVVSSGSIEVDRERYLVRRVTDDRVEKLHLPRKQFELLYHLASNPGVVFSREKLLDAVWGADVYVTPRTVDVHVRKIRDTIGEAFIETVKGVGYRFRE